VLLFLRHGVLSLLRERNELAEILIPQERWCISKRVVSDM